VLELAQLAGDIGTTIFHPVGTAKMGPASDALAEAAERAGEVGWDATWQALRTLRAAHIADLNDRAAPLPRLRSLRLAATLPSVVVAYRLDGDALDTLVDRAADLVARNRVPNPLLVPGGRDLEVLVASPSAAARSAA